MMPPFRRVLSLNALLLLALLTLCGCQPPSQTTPTQPAPTTPAVPKATTSLAPSGFPRTVTDATGYALTLKAEPQRIVSLTPSNTELLYALGLGDKIVLDTTSCDYPPEAKNKPHLDALKPDVEPILAATPDLVVAVGELNGKLIERLRQQNIPTLAINPQNVDETYAQMTLVAQATGQDAKGAALVAEMKRRIGAVKQTIDTYLAQSPGHKRIPVLVAFGDNPIYTTAPKSFISDLIVVAGGVNVADPPPPGNIVSPEKVIALQPEVIVCSPALQPRLKRLPGFATGVPAVVHNRFFSTSTQATLERPSPRLAAAAEELARYLHPDAFGAPPVKPEATKQDAMKPAPINTAR